mmetsp:Transcript_17998/g.29475  ORF Transcript_17998/g.29475 Transcript_17998/m.29475 type:complete len:456 (+) Transcript_17998:333-1700(+)
MWAKVCHNLAKPRYDNQWLALLLIAESLLSAMIVKRVPYTEIDWVAYMQEVTTYQNGERDYISIRGDTGPLVYPAGFLYLYGFFKDIATRWIDVSDPTGLGGSTSPEAIRIIQWVFVILYAINSAVVLMLYNAVLQRMRQQQSTQSSTATIVWCWRIAMGITCLSKRVHSIFVLRLFNDAPAMLLLHISMYLFACCDSWALGCVVFSLAVSIKMNVLLFAPGLLLLLLQKNQSLLGTIRHLSICASLQLLLGWPFLTTYPISYIKKAFEFDRVFFFKWTVNWKFLPEEIFTSKPWALLLLTCHLGVLGMLANKWWRSAISQLGDANARKLMRWTKCDNDDIRLSPEYVIHTMFVSNYVGIVFARTLHYQFYCWYFYSLPMLLWLTSFGSSSSSTCKLVIPLSANVIAVVGVEYAFNVFPATELSSAVLQLSHAYLMLKIVSSKVPSIQIDKQKIK